MYVLGKYITHIFNDKFRIVRMEKKSIQFAWSYIYNIK